MRPYFFFSYARRDHLAGGAFVDQFFTDLRDELARIEPEAGPGELAYRDTERLRIGDDWERQLSRMLGASRTMVALYSPAYFASPYCGKEWTAFDGRTRRHEEQTGESVPALIPVLWEPPPEDLPAEVRRIQYMQHDFGAEYATGGLRHLLRTDPQGTAYRKVVRVIAERIREAASWRVAELRDLDLGQVEGCFPVEEAAPVAARSSLVRLFVAARRAGDPPAVVGGAGAVNGDRFPAQRSEADSVRTDRAAAGGDLADGRPGGPDGPYQGGWYGAHPRDWAPYHPPRLPSLAVQAQQVITRAGHSTSLETVGPDLADALDRARENNEVSVLLVDPWAAGAEPFRQALRDFDRQNHPVTAVLLPDSTDDPPAGPARARLWEGVREVFARTWLHRSGPEPLFRIHIRRERFERELLSTVTVAQNRLLDQLDDDPVAARAQFGLGPDPRPMPGLTIPAWPPVPPEPPASPGPPLPRPGNAPGTGNTPGAGAGAGGAPGPRGALREETVPLTNRAPSEGEADR
ncbi:FxsC C-terminal domain-containing protein [Streptomyces sp. TLI_053]|uniref:TIR-like protein FxsC n=1 Tax=Streptomyces sp. TLI_053 TaxID=1855352 RepID=UPI00087B2187|nr:TIR-like protein FxsC [Streptomyces sp. TLI_053]SDT67408.1 FxsC C-terminal domain-containing protein [Streptomyces sp. TLI_053]